MLTFDDSGNIILPTVVIKKEKKAKTVVEEAPEPVVATVGMFVVNQSH